MSHAGTYDSPFKATLKGITDLFKKRERSGELHPEDRLDGMKIMITGASSGLGKATALEVARLGGELFLALRGGIPKTGQEIVSQYPDAMVSMLPVDLNDLQKVDNLVVALKKKQVKLDVLVSNAALVPLKSRKSKQGLEEMFQVNYLAPFYLINRLLEEGLLASEIPGYPRIVIVSSESHRNADRIDWESFGTYREYGVGEVVKRYGYFKLMLTTFANELSRRLADQKINVRALCPGPVNSNIAREAPGWMKPMLRLSFSLFFRSPEKACEPVVYFTATGDSSDKAMDYFFLMTRTEMDQKATDPETGHTLWKKSSDLLAQLGFPLKGKLQESQPPHVDN